MGVVTAGMVVLVRDSRHGDWAGTVVLTGLPDSPVVVVVLDPLDGVRWRRGQWAVVPRWGVRPLRRTRWSR